jgi:hypothetical protein
MRTLLATSLALLLLAAPALAQSDTDDDTADDAPPTIAEKTEGLERQDGFFPVYWDTQAGKVWLEISRLDRNFLYVSSLPTGLGSNPVGLDRGQLGQQRVVRFERVGPKVLLVQPNLDYRATTDNPAEREAVRRAFAEGVVHGFEVAAEAEDGDAVLVDATDFVVRDAHGVIQRLKNTGQGRFTLDGSRSAPYPANIKAFPQNTELSARLTFTTDEAPGRYVQATAADPQAVTLRVRHSLIQLPDTTGYTPRRFDPRAGFFYMDYRDYAVPIGEDIPQRFINRHRLSCAAPEGPDGRCPVEDPIVYYLDPGTPEPVRSALMEGAQWWAEAFRAAGYEDAFRVEVLPDSADAMDVRYNTIQWVHRRTRGWSYGASVTDPRTGEILKGHVTLGSLRVRQDYLLAEGLLAPYQGDNAGGFPAADDPMLEMALARIRQLAAHEVGHTIGLAHNFAASADDRASVMDYPAPLATVQGDSIRLDDAYDTGIAPWDQVAVRYGYARPDSGQSEAALLDGIIQDYQDEGLRFITDRDARPTGAAHPLANLWDNGDDMVAALERVMDVRRVALDRFDDRTIRAGEPLAATEEVLVPLYLRHRYQVAATAKLVGGVTYSYALRGDEDAVLPTRVGADRQTAAVDALLATLTPAALALPDDVRNHLPPRPPGYPANRELFDGHTGLTFDAYAPAAVAATMVFTHLLHPDRATRLIHQHDSDAALPSLRGVLDRVTEQVWGSDTPDDAYRAELQRAVQQAWTDALLTRAAHAETPPAVQARLEQHLRKLRARLDSPAPDDEADAHRQALRVMIDRFLDRDQDAAVPMPALDVPPGSPIGTAAVSGSDWPPYAQRHLQRQRSLRQWAPPRHRCGTRPASVGGN